MSAELIQRDEEAELLRSFIQQAEGCGEAAMQAIAGRIKAMAGAGGILARKKQQGDLQGWLSLHFGDEAPDEDMQKKCMALHKQLPKLNLDNSRSDVVKALTLCDMLPGFDGPSGVSKRPVSFLIPLYKLHQTLRGMMPEGVGGLPDTERERIKRELQPIIEIWREL